jgi:hypothetical protein
MEYKPSEIAEELATNSQHILRLVGMGAPARKDTKGRFWIHGATFARWLADAAPKNDRDLKARPRMAENECYCVACRKITTYTAHRRKGTMVYGKCPKGHNTVRFVSKKPTGRARTNERKGKDE